MKSNLQADFYQPASVLASMNKALRKVLDDTSMEAYADKITFVTMELKKPRTALATLYMPENFNALVNSRKGWRAKSKRISDLDWILLVKSNNEQVFDQAIFPQSNTNVNSVTVTPTMLAWFLTTAIKLFSEETSALFMERMKAKDSMIAASLIMHIKKRKRDEIKISPEYWRPHPAYLLDLVFPNLKIPSKYSPQFSFNSDGQTVSFLLFDRHRENAHRRGSAAIRKYDFPQRDYKSGTIRRMMEDEIGEAYSDLEEKQKINITDPGFIGEVPTALYQSRECFRKGVNQAGQTGLIDVRKVNTPTLESAFYSDGDIKLLGKYGTGEFLKNHNIISFDPGSKQSGCSGHSLRYAVHEGLHSRSITNKFQRFGSSGLKGDTSKTGDGFEEQRTNDYESYATYSKKFKERCVPLIYQKYQQRKAMKGVSAQRKATQRARSAVANMVMQMNTALNVCI